MRKTKIVCTLGPATDDENVVREMMLAGMNVARFNFSHQTHEMHKQRFDMIVKLREELGLPIATLLDTKGPEIRLGKIKNGKAIVNTGSKLILTTDDILGDENRVSITYKHLVNDVSINTRILIDDGLICLRVLDLDDKNIECEVLNGGIIRDNKGVNVPNISLSIPYVSERDREDLLFGIENGFDFIAASFVRSAQDILDIRSVLKSHKAKDINVIAKIENSQGVENIDEILKVSDGVMVARGDMGVEISFEEIPVIQKKLIKKAYNASKQVITATQMLESMVNNPRPTRAETTDVANAIYDGTSAIMLSGETAAGKYPVQVVKTMAAIAERAERDIDYPKRFRALMLDKYPSVTNAISHASVTTSIDRGASAIINVTKSGESARMISRYRPLAPIIACSPHEKVCRQLNMSWGVLPVLVEEKTSTDDLLDHAVESAQKAGYVKNGDVVVVTAGIPLGVSGTTNLLKVHTVGHVLVSGIGVTQKVLHGNLCVCSSEDEVLRRFKAGDILVVKETSNNILDVMKSAGGIITEVDGFDSHAAIVGLTLNIPVIVGAKNATKILKNNTYVTVDAVKGLVCRFDDDCGFNF